MALSAFTGRSVQTRASRLPSWPASGSLTRAAVLVAPATATANVAGYVGNVVLLRHLGPTDYGAVGAVLGVLLILSVPGIAVQAVVARHMALGGSAGAFHPPGMLLRFAVRLGAVTAGAGALTAVPLSHALHVAGAAPLLWVAVAVGLGSVGAAAQGLLQGAQRFGALTVALLAVALGKLGGALAGLAVGGGLTTVLAGTAAGAGLSTGLAIVLVRRAVLTRKRGEPGADAALARETAGAVLAVLGLLVLSTVDLLMARHYLPAAEAGRYAVGAVFGKATFWGPQFVAILVFPRLTDPAGRRRLLGQATVLVAAIAGAAVLVAWLAGDRLVAVVVGHPEVGLGSHLWLFAASGAGLALAQLQLSSGLAARDLRPSIAVGAAVVVECALVAGPLHHGLTQIVATAAATSLLLGMGGPLVSGRFSPTIARRR